jgi:hypothetical protein
MYMLLQHTVRSFPGGSAVKNQPANAGDVGFNPWVGKIPWRREWLPTLAFLPGEFHGQRSLEGYSPESDMIRCLSLLFKIFYFLLPIFRAARRH